jgi:hypothetical protein
MTIPDRKLIGKNVKLDNGNYSDDYIAALNKFATVDEVFGQHKEAIAKGEQSPICRCVMGTLGKSEYENHLVSLIMIAARAGEWKAVIREPLTQNQGLETVMEKGFGYVVMNEGKKFLLPSAGYVVYCKERLGYME